MDYEYLINYLLLPATTSVSETAIIAGNSSVSNFVTTPILVIKGLNIIFLAISIFSFIYVFTNERAEINPTTAVIMITLTIVALVANILGLYYYYQQYSSQLANIANTVVANATNAAQNVVDKDGMAGIEMIVGGVIILAIVGFVIFNFVIQNKASSKELLQELPLDLFFGLSLSALASVNEALMLFGQQKGVFQPISLTNIVLITFKITVCLLSLLLSAYILLVHSKELNKKINGFSAQVIIISTVITLGSSAYSLYLLAQQNLAPQCVPIIQCVAGCLAILFTVMFLIIHFKSQVGHMLEYSSNKSPMLE